MCKHGNMTAMLRLVLVHSALCVLLHCPVCHQATGQTVARLCGVRASITDQQAGEWVGACGCVTVCVVCMWVCHCVRGVHVGVSLCAWCACGCVTVCVVCVWVCHCVRGVHMGVSLCVWCACGCVTVCVVCMWVCHCVRGVQVYVNGYM